MVLWRSQLVVGGVPGVIVWRLRRDEATVERLCTDSSEPPPNLDPSRAVLDDVTNASPRKGSAMKRPTIRATIVTGAAALLLGGLTAASAPARVTELCFGLAPTIVGTDGDDTLIGTADADVIVGLDGEDIIEGKGGSDSICGGPDTTSSSEAIGTFTVSMGTTA